MRRLARARVITRTTRVNVRAPLRRPRVRSREVYHITRYNRYAVAHPAAACTVVLLGGHVVFLRLARDVRPTFSTTKNRRPHPCAAVRFRIPRDIRRRRRRHVTDRVVFLRVRYCFRRCRARTVRCTRYTVYTRAARACASVIYETEFHNSDDKICTRATRSSRNRKTMTSAITYLPVRGVRERAREITKTYIRGRSRATARGREKTDDETERSSRTRYSSDNRVMYHIYVCKRPRGHVRFRALFVYSFSVAVQTSFADRTPSYGLGVSRGAQKRSVHARKSFLINTRRYWRCPQ